MKFQISWNRSKQADYTFAAKYSIFREDAADIISTGHGKAVIPQV